MLCGLTKFLCDIVDISGSKQNGILVFTTLAAMAAFEVKFRVQIQ